jgi:predicted O-linked N-acetylglucosamine transferase (SPINDLY family)
LGLRQYVTLVPQQAQNATLRGLLRARIGLPPPPVPVAASFNQLYKIDPPTLRLWFRILRRVTPPSPPVAAAAEDETATPIQRSYSHEDVPVTSAGFATQLEGGGGGGRGAALWLILFEEHARLFLRHAARAHGVDVQRLVLTKPLPAHAHLSGKAVADLFLDTPSFNAHSTLAGTSVLLMCC